MKRLDDKLVEGCYIHTSVDKNHHTHTHTQTYIYIQITELILAKVESLESHTNHDSAMI